MFDVFKAVFGRIVSCSCGFILLLWGVGAFCQGRRTTTPVDLRKVFEPTRIKETRYKIVLYNQDADTVTNVSVLDRQIARENYETKPSIRITEILSAAGSRTKTSVIVDGRTLMPVYFEESSNDVVTQKAYFDHGKEIIFHIENGVEKRSEVDVPVSVFLSNCFSELLQANDFGKNPVVRFETVSPGNSPNQFIVESIGEKDFVVSPNKSISCWVLRFTRIDSSGKKSPVGFRYVDKASGRVLMYKSDIEGSKFFTYQYLFLP